MLPSPVFVRSVRVVTQRELTRDSWTLEPLVIRKAAAVDRTRDVCRTTLHVDVHGAPTHIAACQKCAVSFSSRRLLEAQGRVTACQSRPPTGDGAQDRDRVPFTSGLIQPKSLTQDHNPVNTAEARHIQAAKESILVEYRVAASRRLTQATHRRQRSFPSRRREPALIVRRIRRRCRRTSRCC